MPYPKSHLLALLLILVSFALLIPGILLPVFTIKGSISLPFLGKMDLGSQTRSILGTVKYLWETKNFLVSGLIFCFSVMVPVMKGMLLLISFTPISSSKKNLIVGTIKRIGKWSMADVFVVAVFLAYLSTASMDVFTGHLERGFYFFLGYCLVSVLATEFILFSHGKAPASVN